MFVGWCGLFAVSRCACIAAVVDSSLIVNAPAAKNLERGGRRFLLFLLFLLLVRPFVDLCPRGESQPNSGKRAARRERDLRARFCWRRCRSLESPLRLLSSCWCRASIFFFAPKGGNKQKIVAGPEEAGYVCVVGFASFLFPTHPVPRREAGLCTLFFPRVAG